MLESPRTPQVPSKLSSARVLSDFLESSTVPWEFLNPVCRGVSRTTATSKMEHFVIIINGLWALEALYLANSFRLFHHIIQFYSQNLIRKHLPRFIFVLQKQIRKWWEGNRFCCSTHWFTFDQAVGRQFTLGKFWGTEIVLKLWERITTPPHTHTHTHTDTQNYSCTETVITFLGYYPL